MPGKPRHGDTIINGKKHPIYNAWTNMKSRCLRSNHPCFYLYGGRGIKVFDEWLKYEPFKAWAIQNGWQEGLTLDRIDNAGNYEPNNCRWVTQVRQMQNLTNTTYFELNGRKQSIGDWSKELGIHKWTLKARRKYGWDDEKILTTPVLSRLECAMLGVQTKVDKANHE